MFTYPNVKSLITGNYIDNNFIEWTNEHDNSPDFFNQFSFGGLTITGNVFTVNDVAPWFKFLIVKPYGTGHTLNGLTINGNVFRALNGAITRVEGVDNTFADLDLTTAKNVVVHGNTFHSIVEPIYNPCTITHTEASDTQVWTVEYAPQLPFKGRARVVSGLVANGKIRQGSGTVYDFPYTLNNQGPNSSQIKVGWSQACRGSINITTRMDNPS